MTLLLLFPFAGKMLNGGSYVVNRYMWAYSMLVSFIAVKMYPQMMEMHFKKKLHCSGRGSPISACAWRCLESIRNSMY